MQNIRSDRVKVLELFAGTRSMQVRNERATYVVTEQQIRNKEVV